PTLYEKLRDSLKKIFYLLTIAEKNNSWKTLITFNTSVIKYNILNQKQAQYFTSAGLAGASKINEEFQIKIDTALSIIIDPEKISNEGLKL
ncbi:MAG: hypothetical protein H0W50_02340, partial [Parachlamydiaceae bacterium]|nr:hypothetical protein [Parachlamydiaceae bacterium]